MDVSPKMHGTHEVTLVDSDPQSWPEQQDMKHCPGDLSGQESAPVGNLGEQDWDGHPCPSPRFCAMPGMLPGPSPPAPGPPGSDRRAPSSI